MPMNQYDANSYDDYAFPELPEEVDYVMAQHEVHSQLKAGWTKLREILKDESLSTHAFTQMMEYDKLMNYWL